MNSTQIKAKLDLALELSVPLAKQINELKEQYSDALSKEYIDLHDITLDKVMLESANIIPPGSTCFDYANWLLNTNSYKQYIEWNGYLYPFEELICGILRRNPIAKGKHVK